MIINDLFNNKKFVAEGSKMARADKSAKAPKPKDQQEYDAVEKYRKDLAQSYNKEPNFGIKDDEEENQWWIDYDLDEGVAENIADDMAAMAQKKFPTAYISKDGKEVQKPENWGKRYTPPPAAPADLEKQQRDLTAKYPNIDELVRRAELNRDPDYEMADGEAYYAARDAEQNYQKLRQIQRVIQGLNESLNRSHLP
jgi:hypothetical protein